MKIKNILIALGVCALFGVNMLSLYFSDAIVNKDKYSVVGVDVSRYQGVIDWDMIEAQNIDFAFIKATETFLRRYRFWCEKLKHLSMPFLLQAQDYPD